MGHGNSDDDEPEEFADPITLAIMEEAMMAPCGHSFSRESITTWLRQNHASCPVCKRSLNEGQLVPNYALRSAIERHLNKHPHKNDGPVLNQQHPPAYPHSLDAYLPPDPVKPYAAASGASSSSSPPASPDYDPYADAVAPPAQAMNAGGGGGGDEEEGCCLSLTADARASSQGCCTCKCEGPVYCCDRAHRCERGACCAKPYPWWFSPSTQLWIWIFGTNSTYTRRTVGSLCLLPLILLSLVLWIVETVFLICFYVVGFVVISPIWLIIRMPIVALFPQQYERSIKPSCWDKTFGCS